MCYTKMKHGAAHAVQKTSQAVTATATLLLLLISAWHSHWLLMMTDSHGRFISANTTSAFASCNSANVATGGHTFGEMARLIHQRSKQGSQPLRLFCHAAEGRGNVRVKSAIGLTGSQSAASSTRNASALVPCKAHVSCKVCRVWCSSSPARSMTKPARQYQLPGLFLLCCQVAHVVVKPAAPGALLPWLSENN